jgi:acetolactate synthase-1/2/3 large subunit
MGSDSKSGLSFPKYSEIVKAYKIKYFKLKSNKEIKLNIKKIIQKKGPVFCELIMDNEQEQMPKAINRRNSDGRSVPTTFEDMYPFLSKKELIKSSYDYFKKNKRRMLK